MRNLLICIDPAEPSGAVLECARGLAEPGARITLLHVAPEEPEFIGYGVGPASVRDSVAADLRKRHRALEQLAAELASPGIAVTPLVVQGSVGAKILDHAERLGVDFIVLGNKHHGAMHDLIVGSVMRELIRKANVPLVLVPSGPSTSD